MKIEVGDLVARLRDEDYRHEMQHLRSAGEIDRLFQQAATALEAQAAELSSLRMMADSQVVSHRDFNTLRAEKSEAALASERAAHAETKRERDELAKAFAESCSIRDRLASTAVVAEIRLAEVEKALDDLLELNDNHSPFGGEIYQDRVDRAWDAARRVREGGQKDG